MKKRKDFLRKKRKIRYVGQKMYEEKIFTCVECERSTLRLVLEESDNTNYICPSCNMEEMDSDNDDD